MGKRGNNVQKLKTKILLPMVSLIMSVVLVMGAASCYLSYQSTIGSIRQAMTSAAELAAGAVSSEISVFTSIISEVNSNTILTSPESTNKEKLSYIDGLVAKYYMVSAIVTDSSGTSLKDSVKYSEQEFYTRAIKGDTYVSSPMYNADIGKLVIVSSAPITDSNGRISGVVCFVMDQTMINKTIEGINLSANGYTYIIDSQGNTIADPDINTVINGENIETLAQTNASMVSLAQLHKEARSGKSGEGTYKYDGDSKFLAYAPIPNTDGWTVCINTPVKDFTSGVITTAIATIILALLSMIVGAVITNVTSKRLSDPVAVIEKRLALLAEGDVVSPLPEMKLTSLELVNLTGSVNAVLNDIGAIIEDMGYVLGEMAEGNFTVESKASEKYIGDYEALLTAENIIKKNLARTLNEINSVAEQVSAGSDQVSAGAQALAQGATEQASSVEELSATINEIADQVRRSAEESEKANELTVQTGEIVQGSVEGMSQVSSAMDEISEASRNISRVIKAIDDIAFQTNILALNAAVEAARAGAAGKGFAVVADEVRNLAQKSAEAAKSTTDLIESSIAAVEKGGGLVNRASEDFMSVAEKTQEVVSRIGTIYEHAQQQAEAVGHISIGIEQVSNVVQMNSATSEESAAASEELSSQAAVLKGLVEQFQL
ncbi:MAG: methyl-accepting chemotaxis protein [Clostridiales bacterium]|nr:methyl-accepting chemotaxis protein [Clostridiales bacterium]